MANRIAKRSLKDSIKIPNAWQKDSRHKHNLLEIVFLEEEEKFVFNLVCNFYYLYDIKKHKVDEISIELRRIYLFKDRKRIANGCQKD